MKVKMIVNELGKGRLILMAVMFCLLVVSTAFCVRGKDLLNVIPLFVSLVVVILNTQANRYGLLLGGFNSILYALVYFVFGLYSQCLYALLVSLPMQLYAFYRWGKRPYGNSTVFKKLKAKEWAGIIVLFAVLYGIMGIVFTKLGSEFMLLDNFLTLLGILGTILTMLTYQDYRYSHILSATLNVVLGLLMLLEHPNRLPWFLYSCYNFICAIIIFRKVSSLYKEQQAKAAGNQ